METTRCDLCSADDTEIMFAGDAWRQPVPDGLALVRCRRCGLMYVCPRPDPNEITVYYPTDYAPFRPAIEEERLGLMRWMRRRKLIQRRKMVERYSARKSGRILDVGCATGLFLHEMATAGWQATGVELAAHAAEYASTRFGLNVFRGMLEEGPFEAETFDVVTFWDVLEHTFSPSQALAHAARLLIPGGLIAINVPNWDSIDRRLFGPHWIGFDPPRHLYVFSRETLTALLQKSGLRPLGWVCFMPAYFAFIASLDRWLIANAHHYAGPARRLLNLPGARLPFEPAFALFNRLERSGVIAVFATKEGVTPGGDVQHA